MLLRFFLLYWVVSATDCEDYGTCASCTSATSWTGTSCRWCPPISCHAWGSPLNTCSSDQQITDPRSCPAPTTPPGFEVINEMMKDVYFPVPDQEFTTPENIKININNLRCGDVALLNVNVTTAPTSAFVIGVNVTMPGLTVRCVGRWSYVLVDVPLISGDGGVIALATASGQTNLEFFSRDFNTLPPERSSITKCNANVAVVDSTWQGSISANIVEIFKSTVNGKIASEVQSVACKSISSLGANFIQDAVTTISARMAPYKGPPALQPGSGEAAAGFISEPIVNFQTNPRFQQLQNFAQMLDGSGSPAALPINEWIRKLLPGGRYAVPLNIVLNNGTDSMMHTAFTIISLSISGIDSLNVFQPLSVNAPHTLESRLGWEKIELNVGFVFDLAPGTAAGEYNASKAKTERIQIHTSFRDLKLHLAWLLAVSQAGWSGLPLGAVIDSPAPCLLSTIPSLAPNPLMPPWIRGYMANISMLNTSLGDIGDCTLAGFVSVDLAVLFTELTQVALELYEKPALAVLPTFANLDGRAELNDMIQEYLSDPEHTRCPPPAVSEVVNFTANKLFMKVESWVSEYLTADMVNKQMIDSYTKTQSGEAGKYALNEMKLATRIGSAFLSLDRVFVNGLNSVDNITVLHPIAASVLHSQLDMASNKDVSAEVSLYMTVKEPAILNNLKMRLLIRDVSLKGDLKAELNETSLNAFPLGQMFEWQCWLTLLEDPDLENLGIRFGSVSFEADCDAPFSCSSPGFRKLAENLKSPRAAAHLGELATRFMSLLLQRLRPRLDASLENAEEACRQAMSTPSTAAVTALATSNAQSEEAAQASFLETFTIVSSVVGVLAVAGCGFSMFRQYRRYKMRDTPFLSSQPLVLHPNIPVLVRVLVPLLLAVNIVFMVSGHLSLGASVDIEMKLLGDDISVKEFYGFSLSGSLKDMYKAGAWGLLILVAGFSGVWPYAKILLLYWCWLAPPAILDEKSRGSRLRFLDMAGKWSLIDMYVLIQSMVAFHITVSQPASDDPPILPDDFLYVNLHVAPVWGLYSFLFAVTLSLLLSHVALYYHRRAFPEHSDVAEPVLEGDGFSLNFSKTTISTRMLEEEAPLLKESVSGWTYQVAWDSGHQTARMRPVGRVLGGVLLLCGLALQLVASFVFAFEFEVQGVAGLAISWNSSPITNISLVNMAYYLCAQGATDTATLLGLGFISFLYLLATFLMPVLDLVLLSVLWWLPLSVKGLKRCLYALELVSAWCALEVFLVSIIVALQEVGQISGFLVGSNCNSINPFIKSTLIPLGFLPPDQTSCFEVKATLLPGMYLLLFTALFSGLLHFVVSRLAEHMLEDREAGHEKERLGVSGCSKWMQKTAICCWFPFLVIYNLGDEEALQPKVSLKSFSPDLPTVRLPASLGPKKPKYPSSSALSSSSNSLNDFSTPLGASVFTSRSGSTSKSERSKADKYPTSKGKKDEASREIR